VGSFRTVSTTQRGSLRRRARSWDGILALSGKSYLTIPARVRRRCGVHIGDPVLLAATRGLDVVAVYPIGAVHDAITAQHTYPWEVTTGDHHP
jgi:hypothetical protein